MRSDRPQGVERVGEKVAETELIRPGLGDADVDLQRADDGDTKSIRMPASSGGAGAGDAFDDLSTLSASFLLKPGEAPLCC